MTTEINAGYHIKRMELDVAKVKALLVRIEKDARGLVKIDRALGKANAEADGMIWTGCIMEVAAKLEAGHGVASHALEKHHGGERGGGGGR